MKESPIPPEDEFFRDYSYMFCEFTPSKNYDRKCIYCGDYKEDTIHVLKEEILNLIEANAQKKYQEGEWAASKKIQQVIDAHEGLNSDSQVLGLVKAGLEVVDKLESQLERKGQ